MPRDGFEIYNIPSGTHGAPDTTIESARYNAFVDDVAQDMNHPRPILSGGTGADDKIEAMTNLNGEISKQTITNFDSDLLYPGSFYCATTATGSPVTGHAFQGWIYQTDNNNMVVQARDASDTMTPGRLYTREKRSGVWSAWKKDGTTIIGDAEGIASEGGDMFFGIKGVAPASKFIVNSKADATGTDIISAPKAGGVALTGILTTTDEMTVGKAGTSPDNKGVVRFGNVTSNYLWFDGTKYSLNGGTSFIINSGNITATAHYYNSTNYTITDGSSLIHRSGLGIHFQNTSGGSWGYFNANGLSMSVGSITSPGNITASGTVISGGNHYCYGAVYYFNSSNSRYVQWVNDYFYFNAPVQSPNGRLWGSNDFSTPVSNGRLAYIADVTGGTALVEPYGGAVITGFGMAGVYSPILRFRWMQLYTTGWFTIGYA